MKLTNNIPPELQAIKPPSSVQECMDIATSIFHFENASDKYKVFQAQEFFMNHIFDFNKKEFSTILKNKLFIRKYIGKHAYNILKKCGDDEVVYPVILNNWFDKQANYQWQLNYTKVLNKYNNSEQLKVFDEKCQGIIDHLFRDEDQPSDALVKIVIKKEPSKIFKIKSWDDNKIAQWLKDNPAHSLDILHRNLNAFNKGSLIFPKSKKQLYENIVNKYLQSPNKDFTYGDQKIMLDFHMTFRSYPIDYIEYVQNEHPNLFNDFIKTYMRFDSDDKNHYSINGLQYMLCNREDSLSESNKLFGHYKDLMKQPIKEEIGFYTAFHHPFELWIKKQSFFPLGFFNLKDDLENNEKEMLVASAFMILKELHDYDLSDNFKEECLAPLRLWYNEIINDCTNEQFEKYTQKVKQSLPNNPDLIKELSTFELNRELGINSNSHSRKKLKL